MSNDYIPSDGSVPKCVRVTIIAIYSDGSSVINDIREPEKFVEQQVLEDYSGIEVYDGVFGKTEYHHPIDEPKQSVDVKTTIGKLGLVTIVSPPPE